MPRVIDLWKRVKIIENISNSVSDEDLAGQLGVSRSTIRRWRSRYIASGSIDARYAGNHRPVIVDDTIEEMILLKNAEDPFKSSPQIKKELELDVCSKTIERCLQKNGITTHNAAKKPRLNDNQRMQRVAFAEIYKDIDWQNCIFVDESCFSSANTGTRQVKRPRNTRYASRYVNFSNHSERKLVSVWGAISSKGLGPLIVLDSKLNQQTYAEILDTIGVDFVKEQFGSSQCYWVEDNCPAHTAGLVNEWFDSCNALHQINLTLLRLPPKSPDLNLIENVWGNLKAKLLNQNYVPQNIRDLQLKIAELWQEAKQNPTYLNPFYDSIESRLNLILENDGNPIKY